MLSLSLVDGRRPTLWQAFGQRPPADGAFADRINAIGLCRQVALMLVQKALEQDFGLDPKVWALLKKASGAPYLAFQGSKSQSQAPSPFVSLSHSGPYVAVALSEGAAVGVDIEDGDRSRSIAGLARRFSEAEQAHIHQEGPSGFYQIWTGREALGKECEGGLRAALSLKVSSWPVSPQGWHPLRISGPPQSSQMQEVVTLEGTSPQGQQTMAEPQEQLFSLLFCKKESVYLSCALGGGAPPDSWTFFTEL